MTLHEAVNEMTPQSVAAWVEKQPDTIIFKAYGPRCCLFAKYLSDVFGHSVRIAVKAYDGKLGVSASLPDWVTIAIRKFDSGPDLWRTKPYCLRLLREVAQ